MSGFYTYGISKKFADVKPLPLLIQFARSLPKGTKFHEALSAEGDRDILRISTGSEATVLNVFQTLAVEVELEDLSTEDVGFLDLWDAGGDSISHDVWSFLSADIFVPGPEIGRVEFRGHSMTSLWEAMDTLHALKNDVEFVEHHDEINDVMWGFAKAISMQAIVTIG